MFTNKKDELANQILTSEKAIHEEVRNLTKLDYAELSPMMRELLAKVYIRGQIDAIEKLRKEGKEILAKV